MIIKKHEPTALKLLNGSILSGIMLQFRTLAFWKKSVQYGDVNLTSTYNHVFLF